MKFLQLNTLASNPRVAKRLPADIAFRYHALPLAEDNNRITVVMANPENDEARDAISSALASSLFLVQGNQDHIDAALMEIWPEKSNRQIRALVWTPSRIQGDETSTGGERVREYAGSLCTVLNAQFNHFQESEGTKQTIATLSEEIASQGYDLIILGCIEQEHLHRRLFHSIEAKITDRLTTSILIARQPRWPIKKILFVTRCNENDDAAVDWVIRLARGCIAMVTTLTVMPPVPIMFGQLDNFQSGLDVLLTTNTTSGIWLRKLAQRLDQWEIPGHICLRQGEPEWQIRQEIAEGDYDLIVIGAEPYNRLTRWFLGGLVRPLLNMADRPVMIAS